MEQIRGVQVEGQKSKELLANAVKEALRARNWRQVELAKVSGISQSTISNVVNAVKDASPDTLRRLAQALDWDQTMLASIFYGDIEDEKQLLIEQIIHSFRTLEPEELLQLKRVCDEVLKLLRIRVAAPPES